MVSLWKHYPADCAAHEHSLPPAYPWARRPSDVPRYILGEDGYWYDPSAVASDTALLSCTGDLMAEPRMTNAHRYGDSYFFHPLFRYVRDVLHASDLCIANLETTLTDSTPYAGDYHCIEGRYHCNAPACYLDAVRYAGFDVLVTANNHNCDSGISGLWDTLHAIDRSLFMRTGSFLPTDTSRVLLVKVCGIRLAILSYGNRYNGLDEQHFTQHGIDTCLNWFSKEKCLCDVAFAREHGAEFVLCYQHWGRDYDEVPNEQQQRILEELRHCGVDYVVGSHTHCLQAHNVADADGKPLPMMWSMGNFVTNERKELCRHTGILQLQLRRTAQGIAVDERFVPCYVFDEFGTGRFCAVPTASQLNGGYDHPRMDGINAYIRERIGEDLPFVPDHSVPLSALCDAMQLPLTVPDRPVTALAVQSGALKRGAVYFALEELTLADRRRALAAELAAAVTTEEIPGVPCLIVEDVRAAYLAAHALVRDKAHLHTVLVAGQTNKTVTRELITRVLRTKAHVLTIRDSEHPVTAPWQDAQPHHTYAVLELREDHPLGVRTAAALCRPDTVVLTAACDAAALADSLPAGGTLLYNAGDAALCAAVSALRTDITVLAYDTTAIPCPALPFATLSPCVAAAAALGTAFGIDTNTVREAVRDYAPAGYTQAVLSADGVQLVLHMNCKTEAQARAAITAAPSAERRLAVVTAPLAETVRPWATDLIVLNEETDLLAAEQQLLALLREGDTLLLCGDRDACLCNLLRRLFGLTDGFFPHAS